MSNIIAYSEMEQMAAAIAASGLFGMKDKNSVLALMAVAQSEGLHPATAARDLAVVENKQDHELAVAQQKHQHEMEKLEFEHHEHRQCKHVWGDSDHDGHLECQNCGLLKESWDESH